MTPEDNRFYRTKDSSADWGTERQKDQVAVVVCAFILGGIVWAAIDLFFLRP